MGTLGKDELLKELAINGYNVGFGAKKNFATYDIISKVPGIIGLVGLLIGVGQLAYPDSPFNTGISTVLVMASIVALTINPYTENKEKYNERGIKMTQFFNQLRQLYLNVKSSSATEFEIEVLEMEAIMDQFYEISMSNQIFGSDWYAHYKFFKQHQIDWIDEQKNFRFWKDKVPTSFLWFIIVIIIAIPLWVYIFKGELPFVKSIISAIYGAFTNR
ncbi:SLATT domain-containing protein [Priestia megaterium]|uniref:SLATT domain-containing protein n=1 Tax=Priestia megaterium TaxID=1404 RepID=UPI00211DA248|nr:SLATT domain-containing protein [Priestia megaterium]